MVGKRERKGFAATLDDQGSCMQMPVAADCRYWPYSPGLAQRSAGFIAVQTSSPLQRMAHSDPAPASALTQVKDVPDTSSLLHCEPAPHEQSFVHTPTVAPPGSWMPLVAQMPY
jgi:hypothetical protein